MPEFTRGQPRRKAVHDPGAARVAWGRRHDFCAACGAGEYGLHVLTTHEIIGGSGGRSQEPCNWLRLGMHVCHDLASGLDVPDPEWVREEYVARCVDDLISPELRRLWRNKRLLSKITLGIALSLKMRADPDEVNWDRLQELRGSKLPEPEPIPAYFVGLWKRNREVPG